MEQHVQVINYIVRSGGGDASPKPGGCRGQRTSAATAAGTRDMVTWPVPRCHSGPPLPYDSQARGARTAPVTPKASHVRHPGGLSAAVWSPTWRRHTSSAIGCDSTPARCSSSSSSSSSSRGFGARAAYHYPPSSHPHLRRTGDSRSPPDARIPAQPPLAARGSLPALSLPSQAPRPFAAVRTAAMCACA